MYHLKEVLMLVLFVFLVFCLALIAFMLYQKWYVWEERKNFSMAKIYFALVFFWLSFILLLVGGKFGDDLIDKQFEGQFDEINQKMDRNDFERDPYHCSYILGLERYGEKEPKLTDKQFEECKVKEAERQKLRDEREKLWEKKRMYKDIYMFGFIALLWLIHWIGYFVTRKK